MESHKFQRVDTGDPSFCGVLKCCSLGLVSQQQSSSSLSFYFQECVKLFNSKLQKPIILQSDEYVPQANDMPS